MRALLNSWNWRHHGVDCDDDPTSENFSTWGMFTTWAYYWARKLIQGRALRDYGDR